MAVTSLDHSSSTVSEPKTIRLLLVEDSPDDAELLLLELKRNGYDVVHERVETERDMRAALERAQWDAIIADFAMPAFSAPAALEILKETGLDLPFIIVSGTMGEEAAVAAMRSGAHDYVLKGESVVRLCPAIERELRESAIRNEQRELRERLLISDRMASMGMLAAGVAHEINNPLAAVIANLELVVAAIGDVARELGIEPRLRDVFEELEDVRESTERICQIVGDLKIFSRSPDEEQRGPVEVNRILESSLRMARNEVRHRAKLVVDYGEVPAVEANEARLGQVFLNLIINAAQAIAEGDADNNLIRVATRIDPGELVAIEVQDSGSGIPPDRLARIFDPFFTTKPVGDGTGLGLSICHRIVEGFGGTISVDSEVGTGTTFRVLLPPVAGSAEIAEQRLPPAGAASRRGRVLVIDEDVIFARSITRVLAHEHEVATASRATDAVKRIIDGELFDVVVCELRMLGMTGLELHAELGRVAPDHPALMIALGDGVDSVPGELLEAGIRHIDKPFDSAHLRAIINDWIRDHESHPSSAS
jgi:signal transduction histidine kinase